MTRWRVTVDWTSAKPVAAELTVETNSFEMLHSAGWGQKAVWAGKSSGSGKPLRSLNAGRFPQIRFVADH